MPSTTPSFSSEAFLIILAAAMCSILCIFSVFVVLVFHCCKVSNDLSYVASAARSSFIHARNSIMRRKSSACGSSDDAYGTRTRPLHPLPLGSPTAHFLKPPSQDV